MPRSIFSILVGALLLAFTALFLTPSVQAETDAANLTGKLLTMNLGSKTITLLKANGSAVSFKYNGASMIERNGKSAKLKTLMLEDALQVKVKQKVAQKITASGPKSKKLAGKLSDALKSTGALVIKGKAVQATAQTRISRNGKLAALGTLTRSDSVVAHLKTAHTEASGGGEAVDLIAQGPENAHLHGLVTAKGEHDVTIAPSNGTDPIVLNITDETMIELDGEHAAFGDVQVGMQIEASYDPETLNAFSIETDSDGEEDDAHVRGTVAGVDIDAETVTITPSNGGDPVTLNVAPSTEIKVYHECGTLEDIEVGMPVLAEYDTATMLAMELKAGEGDDNHEDEHVEGTVAEVDVDGQTIVITPHSGGPDLTLHVTAETEIEANDEDGTLADIVVGDEIRAEFDPVTHEAFELKIRGNGDGEDGDHEDEDEGEVRGTITAVDLDAHTVTIQPEEGDAVTVNILEETEIKVNGEHAGLSEVEVGAHAKAEFDPETHNASELKEGEEDGGHGGGGDEGGEDGGGHD